MSKLYKVPHTEIVKWAVEALQRSNFIAVQDGIIAGHPEDVVTALTPALEAVAIGFHEGYRLGRDSN